METKFLNSSHHLKSETLNDTTINGYCKDVLVSASSPRFSGFDWFLVRHVVFQFLCSVQVRYTFGSDAVLSFITLCFICYKKVIKKYVNVFSTHGSSGNTFIHTRSKCARRWSHNMGITSALIFVYFFTFNF